MSKSDLGIGLALTQHQRVGIFRQNGTELVPIVDRLAEILGTRDGYSGQERIWRTRRKDGKPLQIELGSFPAPGDEKKYQGRPHDLLVFDEAANMREKAVRFLMGWLRTTDPEQRCRILFCFNPPTTAEGRWIVSYFAPWLDKTHPNPAVPGEIRWFITDGKRDIEVDGPNDVRTIEGRKVRPMSRTFIASRVTDNPHLMNTDYERQLMALTEPLRSLMLHGDFAAGMEDDKFQVIPTAWVEQAQQRWEKKQVKPEMHAIGVDVAMGGRDKTIIARRHGMWFDEPIVYDGRACTDGATVAGYIVSAIRDRAPIHIDLFGVGAQPFGHLMRVGHQVRGINVGDPSGGTAVDGSLRFFNLRSELWWRMREALEPNANTGIALPPDSQLLADLCAPKWEMRSGAIKVQSRDEIVKTIGRSPDYASAYCLALIETMKEHHARSVLRGTRQASSYDPFKDY